MPARLWESLATDSFETPPNPFPYCDSGCADTLDIGETSYAQVLADDLDGNGRLDLLVSTMNGNLYCVQTGAKAHPMKAWTAQGQGLNGFLAK